MKNKKIVLFVVIGLVIAGLSFFGGMKYGSSNSSVSQFARAQNGGFNQGGATRTGGAGMRAGANSGGGLVSGQVLSMDDKSITVKLNNGGSKIIFFSPTTKVEKTVDGVTSDVTVGKQVMITGVSNTDGSVNATSIQLRPNAPVVNGSASNSNSAPAGQQ